MPLEYLVSALVTLLVVVDPSAWCRPSWPSPRACRRAPAARSRCAPASSPAPSWPAQRWSATGCCAQLGITLPAFRIAGGLLLFAVASEMVFGVRIRATVEAGRGGARGAGPQHRRLPARHPADGRTGRDHRDAAAGRPGSAASRSQLASAARRDRRGHARLCFGVFCSPAASNACSASPATWCCRGCSACCSRRWRCNSSSTACGPCWRRERGQFPNTTACMMRPGSKVNRPATTSAPAKRPIIALRCSLTW